MQKVLIGRSKFSLVGIKVRTSYARETDKMKGAILPCVQKYFHGALFEKISNRAKPGVTYCVYTDYESDYRGSYTYFIGEEVTSVANPLPVWFTSLEIPDQQYAKFTTLPAPMPEVIINAWYAIWAMPEKALGGKRPYLADFEVYDERAADHQNIVLDIYVGIEN
jgi:predicted transcriptional regulator YdeE